MISVRGSLLTVLACCGTLAPRLAAQERGAAWTSGLAATLGTDWQVQGVDLGLVRPIRFGPFRFVSAVARLGTFVDESFLATGGDGFVGGVALATETRLVTILDVGTVPQSPTRLTFSVTLEASGYLATNSPLPQGDSWLGLAVLPTIRVVQTQNIGFGFMVGPVAFIGRETDVRALLSIRIELPHGLRPREPDEPEPHHRRDPSLLRVRRGAQSPR